MPKNLVQKIPLEALLKFIHEQPDDRPINMTDAGKPSACGCLMVHYAEEHLPSVNSAPGYLCTDSTYIAAGFPTASFSHPITRLFSKRPFVSNILNYGELKCLLKPCFRSPDFSSDSFYPVDRIPT